MAEELLTLNSLFSNRIFRIPDYQRGYSWGNPQLQDFWNDVIHIQNEKSHYTGMITVEKVPDDNVSDHAKWSQDHWLIERNFQPFYVVDGQQRLTTIIILLNELMADFEQNEDINGVDSKKDIVKKYLYVNKGNSYDTFMFGYDVDNPSNEYFKANVLGKPSAVTSNTIIDTVYTANLDRSKRYFQNKLKDYGKNARKDLIEKLTYRLLFNYFEIGKQFNVHVTFETMNNRGKGLSILELLKNRLIYLASQLEENGQLQDLRNDIVETWKTIYHYLGKNKDRPLDDDRFLTLHWIAYFDYKRERSFRYFLLDDHFSVDNVRGYGNKRIGFDEIHDYVKSLRECVPAWYFVNNPHDPKSPIPESLRPYFDDLFRIRFGGFASALMVGLLRYTKKLDSEESLKYFLIQAERFRFLVFGLCSRRSNTRDTHFYALTKQLMNGVRGLNSNMDLASFAKNIKNEIFERKTDGSINFNWFDPNLFYNNIKELYEKRDLGYYGLDELQYILYKYEKYLQVKAGGEEKVSWETIQKRKNKDDSIEHVYPQTPNKNCWKESFAHATRVNHAKKSLTHSLGNLVLTSQKKNSEMQNNCFEHKKHYTNNQGNEVGFYNGSYSEIEVATYDEWTPETIRDRGIKILQFLENNWDCPFSHIYPYKKMLFLDKIPFKDGNPSEENASA